MADAPSATRKSSLAWHLEGTRRSGRVWLLSAYILDAGAAVSSLRAGSK